MVDEETITTRYRNASLRGKIDIILNYYPGFEEMLQGLRELLCINIEADKMQRRRRELGDPRRQNPEIRICGSNRGHSGRENHAAGCD